MASQADTGATWQHGYSNATCYCLGYIHTYMYCLGYIHTYMYTHTQTHTHTHTHTHMQQRAQSYCLGRITLCYEATTQDQVKLNLPADILVYIYIYIYTHTYIYTYTYTYTLICRWTSIYPLSRSASTFAMRSPYSRMMSTVECSLVRSHTGGALPVEQAQLLQRLSVFATSR